MAEETDILYGLEFKIDGFDDTSMTNGEDAFIIYLILKNTTIKSRKINLLNTTYITKEKEQLEQDIWLSGYITGADIIRPNSFKKAGLVYYKSKLKGISDYDILYVTVELNQEGTEITICFQKIGNCWIIIDKEKTEIEIKPTPKQLEKLLLKRIERLETFEERLGISLQNISIRIDDTYSFKIYCEIHPINGTTIDEPFTIECVLYDNGGLIIDKGDSFVSSDDFFGFQLIEIIFIGQSKAEQISKIRIYPQK